MSIIKEQKSGRKIVVLAGPGESTQILFHFLDKEFGIDSIIVEKPVGQQQLLRRRGEKLGWATVAGQILFKLIVSIPLAWRARARKTAIKKQYQLNDQPLPTARLIEVSSVNSPECIAELQRIQPDVIIVNGTRIISKKVLASVPCPFINTHAGITPLYRGVHGGYWALTQKDQAHCGVTVHLVDAGIDTGQIIDQAIIEPGQEDSFATYPLLQQAAGLPLLREALQAVFGGHIQLKPAPDGDSRLWSHPTLAEYLWYWYKYGVR